MTAETATVLPAFMVVLGVGLWAVEAVETHLECVDAARAGARAVSRGEPAEQVRSSVLSTVPAGARLVITRGAEVTRVEIAVDVRPDWGAFLPGVAVRAAAVAATEPGLPER